MMTINDQELERLARGLGRSAGDRVDPGAVAERVRGRLARGEQVRRPRHLGRWGLAVAAALTVVIATDGFRGDSERLPAVPVAMSELDQDGLGEALDSLVYAAPASEFVGWGIGNMNADELETLLAEMEG